MPLRTALEQAIQEQYDRKFWEAVNAGYAALRAAPTAWADVEQDRQQTVEKLTPEPES